MKNPFVVSGAVFLKVAHGVRVELQISDSVGKIAVVNSAPGDSITGVPVEKIFSTHQQLVEWANVHGIIME